MLAEINFLWEIPGGDTILTSLLGPREYQITFPMDPQLLGGGFLLYGYKVLIYSTGIDSDCYSLNVFQA